MRSGHVLDMQGMEKTYIHSILSFISLSMIGPHIMETLITTILNLQRLNSGGIFPLKLFQIIEQIIFVFSRVLLLL